MSTGFGSMETLGGSAEAFSLTEEVTGGGNGLAGQALSMVLGTWAVPSQ